MEQNEKQGHAQISSDNVLLVPRQVGHLKIESAKWRKSVAVAEHCVNIISILGPLYKSWIKKCQ